MASKINPSSKTAPDALSVIIRFSGGMSDFNPKQKRPKDYGPLITVALPSRRAVNHLKVARRDSWSSRRRVVSATASGCAAYEALCPKGERDSSDAA